MGVDQTWAHLSNLLIYSAMAVYAIALVAFVVDLSRRGRLGRDGAEASAPPASVPALVGGGSSGSDESGSAPSGSDSTAGSIGDDEAAAAAHRYEAAAHRYRAAGIGMALTWLAFALHVCGIVARGLSVHRPPWGNMYEFAVAGSAVVIAVFLGVGFKRDVRFLGAFVVGPVLLTLGAAVTVWYTEAAQLVPALHSYWLLIHVSVAFIASALFTFSFSTAVLQVVQGQREAAVAAGGEPRGRFMDLLPTSADLERLTYRVIVMAFPLWTFTLVAGAIWAEHAWGRYWGWDPKEVWTFVIWVVYAAYLHARVTRGWDGRRAAFLVFAGFACLLFNFIGVNLLFSGLHTYAS